MLKLLVIADDFTGALDTGVQFAKRGVPTAVYTGEAATESLPGEVQVAVVDSESRPLTPEAAYERVWRIARFARDRRVPYCYKKVDSALRGNIGSELAAAMDGFGAGELYFAPAYPKLGRTTRDGVHYYNGVPIANTVFGRDPFEPVTRSDIPGIVRQQSGLPVRLVKRGEAVPDGDPPRILLFDCKEDGDFRGILDAAKGARLLGGSAGLAEHLPELIPFEAAAQAELPPFGDTLLVSGSVNPVTLHQIEAAEKAGLPVFWLSEPEKFDPAYPASEAGGRLAEAMGRALRERGVAVLGVGGRSGEEPGMEEERRERVGGNLAGLAERLLRGKRGHTLAVFGGDTAIRIVNRLGGGTILPVSEIDAGVVLSRGIDRDGQPFLLVTKSGGFGDEDAALRILAYLRDKRSGQQGRIP